MRKGRLIDQTLVDHVVDRINEYHWTWPIVKKKLAEMLVDSMPMDVLEEITGDPQGFKEAEKVLLDYYLPNDLNSKLIFDAFSIIGEEETLYALEGLKLDEVSEPIDHPHQDENT